MHVTLVNASRIGPPIAPIELEYVAEAPAAGGHHVENLDLCWCDDCDAAIPAFLRRASFGLVGVSLRSTDDCAFISRQSCLGEFVHMVGAIRKYSDARIVLGGVGFSTMSEQVLQPCQADASVCGEGEFVLVELANRMQERREWFGLPGPIWRRQGTWHRNPPSAPLLTILPCMSRGWVDNRRYFREGGQAGIETKRGCPGRCILLRRPDSEGTDNANPAAGSGA